MPEIAGVNLANGNIEALPVNSDVTVIASGARTATFQSSTQVNRGFRGVRLALDITAASGTTPTLDGTVQVLDPASGDWVALPGAAFVQATTTGKQELVIYPGVAETANVSVSDVLPRTWRINMAIGGTTPSFTMSIGAQLIV